MKNDGYLISLIQELTKLPKECEWVEFKKDNSAPNIIGEYISALSNGAVLSGKSKAYLVWGIADSTHEVIGTSFSPELQKVQNEELENWLLRLLSPKVNFHFHSLVYNGKKLVILEIGVASKQPVQFQGIEYIRIGSYKKKLKEFPEKERELWRLFDQIPFEQNIAAENLRSEEVLQLLDYPAYFDLLSTPLPESREGILNSLATEQIVIKSETGKWDITNLGAMLLARQLRDFSTLQRKAVRVILYNGDSRVESIREQEGSKGYAVGFEGLIEQVTTLLPSNEVIGHALRKEVPMFPELAIRELVANAIIHQDFHATGTAPMVEIFSNRMEITNPGLPLVQTDRFLDSPPRSRNEAFASFMRRIGICEERGSGIDKVVSLSEFYQLPPPIFEQTEEHTRTVLFSHREFKDMDKQDRIRACYLHACLRYVQRDYMTNSTLRNRFQIEEKNSSMVSRVIKDALQARRIAPYDAQASKKFIKYLPWWAK